MFYGTIVTELVTRSITEFSLCVGHDIMHAGQLLPDIWVGKELYQYQTLDDGERQGYMLTFHDKLLDPYQYVD